MIEVEILWLNRMVENEILKVKELDMIGDEFGKKDVFMKEIILVIEDVFKIRLMIVVNQCSKGYLKFFISSCYVFDWVLKNFIKFCCRKQYKVIILYV